MQDLANKIIELKKQKRGIDKSLAKVEKELCVVFDNVGVNCMEVDIGILVRRKSANGWEWTIDI